MTKKFFKCEVSFKKLQKFHLKPEDCVILNIQHSLCLQKCMKWEGFLKREVHFPREHAFFFVASMLRAS